MSSPGTAMTSNQPAPFRRLGIAWIGLCLALAAHVADEALTGFLSVYNPTVLAVRAKLRYWPMPTFKFQVWLAGLIVGIFVLVVLSPFAFRNARWLRPFFYFCAIVLGIFNAMGHTIATILGHTVDTVRFARPAPGFYSSPLLLAAAVYALFQLWQTRQAKRLPERERQDRVKANHS